MIFFQGKTWDSPKDQKLRTVRRPLQNPPQNVIPKCEDFCHDEVTGFVVEINTKPWRQSEALGRWKLMSPDTYAYSLAIF